MYYKIMKIQQLKAFVTVAGTLNFRRAAEILCMTQPPLSHAIKSLEEDIGVVLLNREQKKNVRLTPAGKSFLLAAQRILQDVERAKRTAQLTEQGEFGSFSLGFTDDFVHGSLPDLLNDYNLKHPNISLNAYQSLSYRLIDDLSRHKIDCILTTPPLHQRLSGFETMTWKTVPIIAMVPTGHPLAHYDEIDLKEISQEGFPMITQNMRTRFDDKMNNLLINAGISSHRNMEILQSPLCAEMVRRGYGIFLASLESIPAYQKGLKVLKIKDKGASLERLIAWREDNDNPALMRFLEMVSAYSCK